MSIKWFLLKMLMQYSDSPKIGPLFMRLAGLGFGPYKGKRALAYITDKPYVSPSAIISCDGVEIGPNCFIDDFVTIYSLPGSGTVRLGKGVHLYRGTNMELGDGACISIGRDTHIQGPSDLKAFSQDLIIGSHVQLAPYCALSSYNHAFDDLTKPIALQGLVGKGPTVVEDDVWLGAGVKVLAGVRIGRGGVIGAGAVVSKDIPPFSIAAGVPARVIRARGEEKVCGRRTESKW
ncbi:MAG: acyltransferase [Dehalococcoidales bacterium]|nr:acyltransferase [Dehalococcoidales bacterium]